MRIPMDIIGSKEKAVAVIDVPEEKIEEAINEITKRYKHVKSILLKIGGRDGIYRIYNTKLIWGDTNTEVIHKEYGYLLKLDPLRVYFSPREAEERKRISKLVKPNERILVMFSGVAPFAIAIAKAQPKVSEIVCVDINLVAAQYAEQNIKLNKLEGKIKSYCWDVREATGLGKFDRILMPLPEFAYQFLDVAYNSSKPKAIIHLYGISEKSDFSDFEEKIKETAKRFGFKFKILKKQKVSEYAPYKWKVRFDLIFS